MYRKQKKTTCLWTKACEYVAILFKKPCRVRKCSLSWQSHELHWWKKKQSWDTEGDRFGENKVSDDDDDVGQSHIVGLALSFALSLAALAASGYTESLLEPLLAAFEALTLGFVGKIWPQHTHILGPSLLHSLHTLNCSLHLLSVQLGVPVKIQKKNVDHHCK